MVTDTSEVWLDHIFSQVVQKRVLGAIASICDTQQHRKALRMQYFPGGTQGGMLVW